MREAVLVGVSALCGIVFLVMALMVLSWGIGVASYLVAGSFDQAWHWAWATFKFM
jgi:hypothetical protein